MDSTILCTIHQPSSEVFFLFDVVIFMKEGRIFYQGPADGVVSYFSRFDYVCPKNFNPSDYVMFLMQSEATSVLDEKNVFMKASPDLKAIGSSRLDGDIDFSVQRSWWSQLVSLYARELTATRRDTGALAGRFGVTILLNLIFSLIFLGSGDRDDSSSENFNTHFGAVAMVLISSMFGSAQPVLISFPYERPMFMREYSTGTCKYNMFYCVC